MKPFLRALSLGALMFSLNPDLKADDLSLAVVRHHWIAKIVESNYVTIRPGSVYDMRTYFEENFGFFRPQFNYLFNDTGLGTADPIYPVFQKGYQESWFQLLPAMFSKNSRHIDHYSELPTPEGCLVKAAYFVRHINDFPDLYHEERAQGYTLVDIGFNYFVKQRPDAECGRHRANDPDPKFDPMKFIRKYAKRFRTGSDIPADQLKKFEFKIGILKLVKEEFGQKGHPRFKDVYTPEKNSMWYYPNGIPKNYGLNTLRPQAGLAYLNHPSQLIFETDENLQENFPLSQMVQPDDFKKFLNFIHGRPTPDFDPKKEPGHDTLDIRELTARNFYSRGLNVIPIKDVEADVSNLQHFKLVGAIVRPYEEEADQSFHQPEPVPQIRLVYQLMDSENLNLPVEQLYLHLNFDAIDRYASAEDRATQHRLFMQDLDQLTYIRERGDPGLIETSDFLDKYTDRGPQSFSFSSSLTGIWVFGMLTKSFSPNRSLEPLRIIRSGVDVGYYSTAWDNELFRDAVAVEKGPRKKELLSILDDVTPKTYRDPRRMDARKISFNRMTCAQCHQMNGRDAVHMAFNDHLDHRVKGPVRVTEFVYHELDRQLTDNPWFRVREYLESAFK